MMQSRQKCLIFTMWIPTCLFMMTMLTGSLANSSMKQAITKTPASVGCLFFCPYNITYDLPEQICSYEGFTYINKLCPYGLTFISCTQSGPPNPTSNMTADVVVKNAGTCACPSNCSSSSRGACISVSASDDDEIITK